MCLRGIFYALVMLGCSAAAYAATLVVDVNGGGQYTAIQPAIDAAVESDIVLVKPGEYVIMEPITFGGKGITVRGEGGPEATAIRLADVPVDALRASVVVFENGETSAAVLEGLTLTGGEGIFMTGLGGYKGGGVHCRDASPQVRNCTVVGNTAFYGGGVYCGGTSSSTFVDCTIAENAEDSHGGGVYCGDTSSPVFTNCTIIGNSQGVGGGVYCDGASSPTLTNCTIAGNCAHHGGGGVYCGGTSSPTFTGCIVWDNAGGAFHADAASSPAVTYSCIEGDFLRPGEGNINQDPLFCGWSARGEVWVDPSRPMPGDGSQEDPYAHVREATRPFLLSLSSASPCLGTGKNGADMGAAAGRCDDPLGTALVVHLADGTYHADDFDLVHGVRVLGSGEGRTIIQGTLSTLAAGSLLSGVTITGGTGSGIVIATGANAELADCTIAGNSAPVIGGGVYCAEGSSLTLRSCTITGNWSGNVGGGVYCDENSSLTLIDCTISGNSAEDGGGVCGPVNVSLTLMSCRITGNSGRYRGGGVFCNGAAMLTDCTITENSSREGGGVRCSGPLTLTGCTITGNSSVSQGSGGVWCGGALTATNCTIAENSAPHSIGGVYCGGTSTLRDCMIAANDGASCGGVLCDTATYSVLTDCAITANSGCGVACRISASPSLTNCAITANFGGGVSCAENASAVLTNCEIAGNWGAFEGGGVYCGPSSSPTLVGCTIRGNGERVFMGGGLYCERNSSPVLTSCTIAGNTGVGEGGGVYCAPDSAPVLTSCTIAGNAAAGDGGGMYCAPASFPVLTNCAVTGNAAVSEGAGVYCAQDASPVLMSCTIAANWAVGEGGGVYYSASSPTLANCIVWGNAGGAVNGQGALMPAVSYSCIEGDLVWAGNGNISADPRFVRPGRWEDCGAFGGRGCVVFEWDPDTGDPVALHRSIEGDYHLRPDSPCLDAGSSDVAATDIEGKPRPCGSGFDMGAYERSPCAGDLAKFSRGDVNSDERVNIADAVFCVSYIFDQGPLPECPDAADANDDAKVDIADAIRILGHLFAQAGPLPAPFGECALDPTPDDLECLGFSPCEGR